jgi:hypothetical protein
MNEVKYFNKKLHFRSPVPFTQLLIYSKSKLLKHTDEIKKKASFVKGGISRGGSPEEIPMGKSRCSD